MSVRFKKLMKERFLNRIGVNRGHCCLLSVSKEAAYQCTKDYWYTACIVL